MRLYMCVKAVIGVINANIFDSCMYLKYVCILCPSHTTTDIPGGCRQQKKYMYTEHSTTCDTQLQASCYSLA